MALSADEWRMAWGKLIAQAWSDEAFKQRLLEQPAEVLKEVGLELRKDMNVSIVEQQPDELLLVLPRLPENVEITDELLEAVAGGLLYSNNCSM